MKTAARRDIQWELQKHETHQVVERTCGLGSPIPSVVECRLQTLSSGFLCLHKVGQLVNGSVDFF